MAIYNPKKYNDFTVLFQYFVIWFFLAPFFYILCRLKVHGRENIPSNNKPFIVMPNHLSNYDPPMVSAVINKPLAHMAKEELFEVPFLNWFLRSVGVFSVDREKVEKTTVKAAIEIVKKNWGLVVFLEGTRSKTPGVLGKPNVGPAYFSRICGVPILPVGITGSDKPFGPITVKIGKLFIPDNDLEKARWQCAEKLAELTGFRLLYK